MDKLAVTRFCLVCILGMVDNADPQTQHKQVIRGMKKTIFALALGTFGLGMAEFGIMGVLPELAHDVGISIPVAGNMISW